MLRRFYKVLAFMMIALIAVPTVVLTLPTSASASETTLIFPGAKDGGDDTGSDIANLQGSDGVDYVVPANSTLEVDDFFAAEVLGGSIEGITLWAKFKTDASYSGDKNLRWKTTGSYASTGIKPTADTSYKTIPVNMLGNLTPSSLIGDLEIKFYNEDLSNSVYFDSIWLEVTTNSEPAVSLTYPADNAAISNDSPTLTWAMSDADNPTSSLVPTITLDGVPSVLAAGTTSYPTTSLAEGLHTWKISVTDGTDTTIIPSSGTYSFTVDTVTPNKPTDIGVKRINSATISWGGVIDLGSGTEGYNIYRNDVLIESVVGAATTSYFDATAPTGYLKYSLTTVDQAGNESDFAYVPLVPDVAIDGSTGAVKLAWTTHPGNTGYSVWKGIGGTKTMIAVTTGNTYTDLDVKVGETYTYAVRAYNSDGNHAESIDLSVLIPEPNIPAIGGGAGREISGTVSGAATIVQQGTTETQTQAGGEVQGAESNQNANANENANENANVNANENTNSQEEEAGAKDTNWPLIVAIIIAGLIVIGGGLYWWFSREEDEI